MKAKKKLVEIRDYDKSETGTFVDANKKLSFEDIGLELPKETPTQVVSIRLPTTLLNEIKAFGSKMDVPYQALINLLCTLF